MGTITREASAPIVDGETASGAELELEFSKIFTLVNGNIDTANISSSAGILGTHLANTTVPAGKITADTITTSQMAASAVAKVQIETDTGSEAATTETTLQDVPGISSITATAGSASDYFLIDFVGHLENTFGGAVRYEFALSIDGVDTAILARWYQLFSGDEGQVVMHWAVAAGSTGSQVIKPRYKHVSDNTTVNWGVQGTQSAQISKLLRVQIIPIK